MRKTLLGRIYARKPLELVLDVYYACESLSEGERDFMNCILIDTRLNCRFIGNMENGKEAILDFES